MSESKMRVILLTHGQCEEALKQLLALNGVTVAGVFVETDTVRRYSTREALRRSLKYEGYAATLKSCVRKLMGRGNSADAAIEAARESGDHLRRIAEAHNVPVHFVRNFHAAESIALMRAASADLGVIYGTNIIKESVFKLPRLGSINLHQGLAPYYRGGPPVFWELFNGEEEVGITVHFVEAKVDTGEIVLQETVPLRYDYAHGLDYESFIVEFGRNLRTRSARMVAEAVRLISEGSARTRAQDTSLGKRYRLPTKKEKDELRRRLRRRRRQSEKLLTTDAGRGFDCARARGTEDG
ncbi:MAG TPA: formyltransferase family protein [Pyrinomonadaceae bacterium]|nr:formyltransferase family protein [Pyrinomonadaceae bacterium]